MWNHSRSSILCEYTPMILYDTGKIEMLPTGDSEQSCVRIFQLQYRSNTPDLARICTMVCDTDETKCSHQNLLKLKMWYHHQYRSVCFRQALLNRVSISRFLRKYNAEHMKNEHFRFLWFSTCFYCQYFQILVDLTSPGSHTRPEISEICPTSRLPISELKRS